MTSLERFVQAQGGVYPHALSELRNGLKTSHWMWFVFPQIAGLGRSPMARQFAIRDLGEAHAYLGHDVLGPGLARRPQRFSRGVDGAPFRTSSDRSMPSNSSVA